MGLEAGESSSFLSLSSAFSYGVASMAMVFVNKAVIMQYVHSMTLLTLQLATALFIHFGQVLGMSKRKDLSIATAKKLLHVSIFYNAKIELSSRPSMSLLYSTTQHPFLHQVKYFD